MNDIKKLKKLSSTTSKDFEIEKLDRIYNEILFPEFAEFAKRTKSNKIRITKNMSRYDVASLMQQMFGGKYTVQSLIETEMRPYLESKGFKVHIWEPNYSVEVSW